MLRVADAIEQHPEQYDQSDWKTKQSCGTNSYCVAGWAQHLCFPRQEFSEVTTPLCAAKLLALTEDEAVALFSATWEPHEGLSVPDALREIAGGATIEDVSA